MKKVTVLSLFVAFFIIIQACKKETELDKSLLAEVEQTGYVYYQNGDILQPEGSSPHGPFKLRFNGIAASVLDSLGELPVGATFPDGSIIVKDVYSGGNITLYAIMKKDAGNDDAGNGWLWAEIEPGGTVAHSTSKKGNGCVGCHNDNPNRDLTQTFDLH